MQMKIAWMRETFPWMGRHSGYDRICDAIVSASPSLCHLDVFPRRSGNLPWGFGKICRLLTKKTSISPGYDKYSLYSELQLFYRSILRNIKLVHITYVENHLSILPIFSRLFGIKIIGTVHQPSDWWREYHRKPGVLSKLDALIVLSKKDIDYFQTYLPDRVFYVPHGVNTEFFHPVDCTGMTNGGENIPRFIFVGKWLRDQETLASLLEKAISCNPSIQFDLVVPRRFLNSRLSYLAGKHKQVDLYSEISDDKLRSLYQKATGLLLPLKDCTANNALLEAVSCGLPVISNDVGAIRDYTHHSFADLFSVGDVDGMISALLNMAGNGAENRKRRIAARSFVEMNFSWHHAARKTMGIYQSVLLN